MANLAVISMNAGKLTPLIDVRSDTEKYSSGCRRLDNMIPRIYGPVERRPGTKYITNVQDHDVKSKMFSFIFSATIAYKLEFSDLIIKVYFGSTLVDTVTSPYLEADLFQLQFKQSADVMWIVHPSYAPRKLSRVSVTEFTLDTIVFDKGPFIERNDIAEDDDVTMAITGYLVATASTGGGVGTDNFTIEGVDNAAAVIIGALFVANQRFYVSNSTGNDGAYTVHATTATDVTGTTVTIYANESIDNGTDDGEIIVAGGTGILTASSATFESGHVNALFKLTQKRVLTDTSGSKTGTNTGIIGVAIDIKGSFNFNTHKRWIATVKLERNEDGTNWETYRTYVGDNDRNVQLPGIEKDDNVQYRINVTAHTSGTIRADITANASTQDGIVRISSVISSTKAVITFVTPVPEVTVTKRWAEGAWSGVRGYPSAVTFFGERIIFGFTNSDQQNIWLSEVGKFEDFEAGINDADAFTLTLPTANRGRWLGSLEVLAAGTSGDEWRIRSSTLDEALTPKNWDIKRQGARGSADIQALEVNEAIIFIDYVARKIREFTYNDDKLKYVSPDLTALAEDITSGGITSVAIQKNPDSILWFTIANSPYLISMTYEREQNVVAFANHPLGGDGIVESICVTPSTSEDIITLTVRRTINGSTVRFIEEMQPRDWGSDDDDAFFVDAGIIDTGGSTTITGLGHLEGETVAVLVDGAKQATQVVSGSQISITESGDKVIVGLPYTYQLSPMRLDVTTAKGTTHGSIKKISEIVASFYKTGGARFGDGIDTYDIDWRTEEAYDTPPALFTGDKTLSFDGGFSTEDNIIISGSDPLPCTLRAIIARIDITGR